MGSLQASYCPMPEFNLRKYGGLEAVMDVAAGADRHLGITFGLQAVESSSHVSVRFREAFSHPYITFFSFTIKLFF